MNRPDVRNAIDATMAEEIYEVAQLCANDPAIRAVLMLANGKSFTVGGDLAFLANTKPGDLPGLLRAMTGPYHEALRTFSRLSVPIVAGVQGAAAGGGLGMMYCADIVLAAENAKFATGFGALGLSMDGANSRFLPRLVGMRRAAELYFEERVLDANEALEWGLVTRVVPLAQLQEQALACATRLANGPTRAYGEVRRLYRESLSATLAEQLGAHTRGAMPDCRHCRRHRRNCQLCRQAQAGFRGPVRRRGVERYSAIRCSPAPRPWPSVKGQQQVGSCPSV